MIEFNGAGEYSCYRQINLIKGGYDMSLAERIMNNLRTLPESKQVEVLDFVEYLRSRAEKEENIEWNNFSLSSAMREIEDEKSLYSINDIKETFS